MMMEATKKEKERNKAIVKFTTKIAKMETGCAPSAGYMEQLILEAREALGINITGNNPLY